MRFCCFAAFVFSLALLPGPGHAAPPANGKTYGPELQGFDYPYSVSHYRFESQRQMLEMAYMDVAPAAPANGQVAVLLHGKNFCSATWVSTIKTLTSRGYRVIAPDQIGFCKSSKPQAYQFTFQQLAGNTHQLLASLGISHIILMGHSTGGMLAIRYALMYPDDVQDLVLVDPVGFEDWSAKGVPWISVDRWYANELKTTQASVKDYELKTYYAGIWQPQYDVWVEMLAGMYAGPGKSQVAWDSALLYDMILTEPVVYNLHDLRMPVLLMVGDKDTTAIGKQFAPPALRSKLGDYATLGKAAAAKIPDVKLVEFPGAGHAPQLQVPEQFDAALLTWLAKPGSQSR